MEIKVIPGAKVSEWVSFEGNQWKIRIQAQPEKGKANEELIRFLSQEFKLPKKNFTITFGMTGRIKKVAIEGISQEQLEQDLLKKLL